MAKKTIPFLIAIAALGFFAWKAIKSTDATKNPLILIITMGLLIGIVFIWDMITRTKK